MGGCYQFPAMRKLTIQKSDGFLLVYSIDSIPSFEETKRLYDIIVDIKGSRDVPVFLVGNKVDISLKRVSGNVVCTTINSWGNKVQRIEASAKNNKNVDTIFHKLIEMIDERKNEQVQINTLQDMTRCPIRKLSFALPLPLTNMKTVHTVKMETVEEGKRSRVCSFSESDNYTINLLHLTVSPVLPAITKYMNHEP